MQGLGGAIAENMAWVYAGSFVAFALLELAAASGRQKPHMGRLGVNFGLFALGTALSAALPVGIFAATGWAEGHAFGLLAGYNVPNGVWLVLAVTVRSFAAYWVHRASHSLPILWRLHRVHHSDREFDVTLGLRHHPLELVPGLLVYVLVAVALGLPVWAVAFGEALMVAASLLEHADTPMPRWLAGAVVTPDVHRIHHSARREQTDSNFGTLLTCWDRLFGTWRAPGEAVERIGLGDVDDQASGHLGRQLLLPLRPPGR